MKEKKIDVNGLNRIIEDEPRNPSKLEEPVKRPNEGSYRMHKDSKMEDTATDVYYKTECKIPDSKVAIPTEDAVIEAKEWVDDENRK
ncbi:DUF3787 domain-containing protein [Paratissierella segnis]|nr:DUF3787 domain-containing protein [Paratissierella segnis]